ncbi:hypothetical protein F5Y19DRAFT_230704 [Xylariaceae sp. FL1651]|nr:hypothetical protein F5Y19DRAFT_230704 [Xylariaceae sp. FL1651]
MPHRVVDFFLSPNDSIHTIKQTVQRRTTPKARTQLRERQRPTRTSSYASSTDGSVEDHTPPPAAKMSEHAKEKHKEHHRLSFPGLHLGGHRSQKDLSQNPSASLDWKIESPPVVMHGGPEDSTGALVSGQMLLCVKEEPFEVENFEAKLEIHVTQKKPFNSHCHDCTNQRTELKKWSFLSEPTALTKRTHEFPFSVLLEGHLPATTDNHLLSIQYCFTAEARLRDGGLPLKLSRKIDVRRSLPVPETPHHSLRIFPPTNITASVHYDAVVHPLSTNRFTMQLDGIGKHNASAGSVEYWKLKRLSWKLEEHVSTVAPACSKHTPKNLPENASDSGSETKKGAARSDTRVLAHADMHSGWKADYYSENGHVDAEINYQTGGSASRPVSCDVRGRDGTEVSHRLVVEMVVAQEYAPLAHTRHITPTGVARILRMNFGIVITERAGLGVSWDNEAPPIYQDVPPSPPSYACAVVQHGSVEEYTLSPASGATTPTEGEESPAYREFPAAAESSSPGDMNAPL